jgi:DNA-binding Xre family transcriptional regulator
MASKGGVIVVVSGEDKTGEVFAAVKKHLDETQAAAKSTSESLGNIGKILQSGLQTAGIAIGIAAIVQGFKSMVTSTMEAGVQLAHLNQQTGISVENLSILKYAAQSTGVDFDTLTRGFKKLAVTAYEADNGNKTAAKGFAQLGISTEQLRAKGDDMYGVLTLIADKFHAMPDGINKSDTAAKIFGARMGSEMIPVLDALGGKMDSVKAEAQALGIVWDEAGIQKMEEMHKTSAKLQGALQGLGLSLISDLATPLETVIVDLTTAITKMQTLMDIGGNIHKAKQGDQAATTMASLPLELRGFSNPDKTMHDAAAQKGALEAQLRAAGLSEAKKAELQKQWHDADLRENAAYFQKSTDQVSAAYTAREKFVKGDPNDHRGRVAFLADDKKTTDNLTNSLAQQAAAMSRLNDAMKTTSKTSSSSGGGGGAHSGSRGGAAGGDGLVVVPWSETALQSQMDAAQHLLDEAQTKRKELFDEAAARAAADGQAAWDKMNATDLSSAGQGLFGPAKLPKATLAPQAADHNAIDGEAEKFAHGVFDPLFDLGEKWDKQWKQIRTNMLKDIGQTAESQLFKGLFGDSTGRGGKGWDGSGGRKGVSGTGGAVGAGLSSLEGLFHKKSSPVSNGTGATGAGTVLSSVASSLQAGKAAGAGAGGVQVIINNTGTPQQVDSTLQSGGGADPEQMVIQIMTKDLNTHGPMSQGILGLLSMA